MIVSAKVRSVSSDDSSILELSLGNDSEPLRCTRIHMAVVPPSDGAGATSATSGSQPEPGYCAVVAELFDGDPRQKLRPKLLVDEATALVSSDFSAADQQTYRDVLFTDFIDAQGQRFSRPVSNLPTLQELRGAAIALKDAYWWDNENGPMQIYLPPNEPEIFEYIRRTEGLSGYPEGFDDTQLQAWYPLFRGTHQVVGINPNPPGSNRQQFAREMVETLLARDLLQINSHCDIFRNPSLVGPVTAVAILCAAMELHEWTHQVRSFEEPDGYETIRSVTKGRPARDRLRRQQNRMVEFWS